MKRGLILASGCALACLTSNVLAQTMEERARTAAQASRNKSSDSDALQRTRDLAVSHAQQAADALGVLPPSPARDALLRLCFDVLNRKA